PQRERPAAAVRAGRGGRLRPDRSDLAGRHPGGVPGRPGRPLADPDSRLREEAVRRTVLVVAVVLVAAAGIGYYRWANREAAARLYRRSADCPPLSPAHRAAALLTLADLLTELGRGEEAAPLYEQVHAADPSDPWAAYRVGKARAERGESEAAARTLLALA